MPSWWEELTKIPGIADHQEFAWKVCTSFEVPKACNWVKKVNNYHTQPLAHPSIGKHHFLQLRGARFSSQDIHLTQLQHTIAYARALQHWAKEVHLPVPGQPHHLVRGVQALQWAKATHHFHRGRCLCDHGAIQMDGNNLTKVNGGHATRVPEEPHLKQQGTPKGISVCDPQQRPACCYSHAGPYKCRSTDNSTPGVYATWACIWLQAPMPNTWFCGDCPDPEVGRTHQDHPAASCHQHPVQRGHRPLRSWGDGHDSDQATLPCHNYWSHSQQFSCPTDYTVCKHLTI